MPPTRAETVPVARSRPGLEVVVGIALGLIVLAVAKPWAPAGTSAPPPSATDRPAPAGVPDRSAASADPGAPSPAAAARSSLRPDQIACRAGEWQLVSLDRLGGWTARTWLPAAPVLAAGPGDPAIPSIALDSPAVLAVGACAPTVEGADSGPADGGDGGARIVAAWEQHGTAVLPFAVEPLEAPGPGAADAGLAPLYRPAAGGWRRPWPAGRYIVQLEPLAAPFRASGPRAWYLALVVRPADA